MSNETIIHIPPAAHLMPAKQEKAPALVKKIGKTTYRVKIYFSPTNSETMSDKIKRMLCNEVQQMKTGVLTGRESESRFPAFFLPDEKPRIIR